MKIKDEETMARQVVKYESRLALYGGEDGLDYVRGIIKGYRRVLQQGGVLAIEYGGESLTGDLSQYEKNVVMDYYGKRRFIIIQY